MHALLNTVQYTCQCKEIQCQAVAVGEVERIHAARALVIHIIIVIVVTLIVIAIVIVHGRAMQCQAAAAHTCGACTCY